MIVALATIASILALVGIAAYFDHFHGRSFHDGIDHMLGRLPPIVGSSNDRGIYVGDTVDTIELITDKCDLCQHQRGSHKEEISNRFNVIDDRCYAKMGPFDTCPCRRFTRFRKQRWNLFQYLAPPWVWLR